MLYTELCLQPTQGRRLRASNQFVIPSRIAEDLVELERLSILELIPDSVGKEGGKAGTCFALVIKIAEQPVVVVVTHQLVLAGPADQQVSTDAAEELVGTF